MSVSPMSAADFDRTLALARGGDSRAFGRLFDWLQRPVHTFARARHATDPEGTVNDVFLQVFTHLGDFDGNDVQFRAWVFRITRNRLTDEYRLRARRPDEVAAEAPAYAATASDDVEAAAISSLDDAWLQQQLDLLTPDQRDVVLLRVVADLSLADVAELVGKPVGAVKALQSRAFRTIARNNSSSAVSP